MRRRQVLQGGAALLAMPAIARAQSATTLKFVPYADLALLDPLVSAFVTRNHVMMVFDTLFSLDEQGVPQPQMLAGYTVEDDGRRWTLTLRPGFALSRRHAGPGARRGGEPTPLGSGGLVRAGVVRGD